jgi:hypothetical protein
VVGRTPWSAADAPVGLVVVLQAKSGSRGTRADRGSALPLLGAEFLDGGGHDAKVSTRSSLHHSAMRLTSRMCGLDA